MPTPSSPRQPMPPALRRTLLGAAVLLGGIAAAGNFGHVVEFAQQLGQPAVEARITAATPDLLIVFGVLSLKYSTRAVWVWAGLLSSVGFVGLASWSSADGHGVAGRLVAVWLLWVAVVAAGLIETKPQPAELTEPATKTEAAGQPAAAEPPAPEVPASEPPPVRAKTPPARPAAKKTPAPAPVVVDEVLMQAGRRAARAIAGRGENLTRDRLAKQLRADGHGAGTGPVTALLAALKSEAA